MTDDQLQIRELVENWAVWRDANDWDRFRGVWHPEGRMMATWWQGPYEEFIRVSQEGFDRGVRILHFLGGNSVDVAGDRAISQTKMTISQRAEVDGVLCDVVCTGRFYDFFERREGRWGLVLRQPIYERDRLDPDRLRGQARHARPQRPRGRGPLRARRPLARGRGPRLSRPGAPQGRHGADPRRAASVVG